MTWRQIDPGKHSWLASIDESDKPTPSPITRRRVSRCFVPKGKRLWPLLYISVGPSSFDDNPLLGFSVHASLKDGPEDWYEKCGVPNELHGVVSEMIEMYIKNIEGLRTDYEALMREEMDQRRAARGA